MKLTHSAPAALRQGGLEAGGEKFHTGQYVNKGPQAAKVKPRSVWREIAANIQERSACANSGPKPDDPVVGSICPNSAASSRRPARL